MSNVLKVLARGGAVGEYEISRSLRFNSADSAYLSRTPASAGNRKTWTWSGWVKRSGFDSLYKNLFSATDGSSGFTGIRFYPASGASSDTLQIFEYNGSTFQYNITTNQVFRDPNAWCHIFVAFDSTDATSTNRIKLYFNGIQVTSFSGSPAYPSLNLDGYINNTNVHTVGSSYTGSPVSAFDIFSGYMAEVHFVDGQALTPSSFGEINAVTGVWSPIEYTGTYGTNGFYLDFSDNTSTTTLGYDAAGSNDWTLNNFSVTAGAGNDSLVDSPTRYGTDTQQGGEVRGNYSTLNSLLLGSAATMSNGNLDIAKNTSNGWRSVYGTVPIPTTGKWYWEMTAGDNLVVTGITVASGNLIGEVNTYPTDTLVSYTYYGVNGQKYTGPGNTAASYGATYTSNDVVGMAFDADAGTLTFYKNGSSQGTAFTGLTAQYLPTVGYYTSGSTHSLNFGQRPWAHTPPSGFKALCTTNLPDPTVLQGDDYFNTVLYTGDSVNPRTITGVGFQPDFVWIKARSTTYYHRLWDAVRGVNKELYSNDTLAESTDVTYGQISAFTSDGFTLEGSSSNINVNNSGVTFVAWNWNAGGSNATNTDGTITSTVRANPTAGISIVSYTATGVNNDTVGHGLGVIPDFWIVKTRDASRNWLVYTQKIDGSMDFLNLNGTAAKSDSSANAPTSSVFSIYGSDINTAGEDCIAYVFAAIPGYSAFGSYTGNGSADGIFAYLGFRPAWLLLKETGSTSNWILYDNKRDAFNVVDLILSPNLSNAESSYSGIDFVSNGFKFRSSSFNSSGATYIYAAFAENPFKYALAR